MNESRPLLSLMRSLAFRLKVILTALTVFHVLLVVRALFVLHGATPAAQVFGRTTGVIHPALETGSWFIGGLTLLPVDGQQMHRAGWATALYVAGLLVIAVPVACIWTAVDWRRTDFRFINVGVRVYARYALGMAFVFYGMLKIVPVQFGFLSPGDLIRPFGQMSPMTVLWHFMQTSVAYTVFAGTLEVGGGVLLFFRRTTLLGSLILGAVLVNILVLSVSYDVGRVAPAAVSLGILELVVLAPYLRPLFELCVLRKRSDIPDEPGFTFAAAAPVLPLKVLFIGCLLALRVYDGVELRKASLGTGLALDGIFDVVSFTRNDQVVTESASDAVTWKRVATDGQYGRRGLLSVQFANLHIRSFVVIENSVTHTWFIQDVRGIDIGVLHYAIEASGAVILDGVVHGMPVRLELRRLDRISHTRM